MKKKLYVTDLPLYFTRQIEELFFVRDLALKKSAVQKEYLDLYLQDKTGTVSGIMWEEYIKKELLYCKGHVALIKGMVVQNQKEQYEILVTSIEPMEDYDQGAFVNGLTEADTKKYLGYLHNYIENVKSEGYRTLLQYVFSKDEAVFAVLPATLKNHHSYNGGLLVHTVTVTSLVRYMSRTLFAYNFHPSYEIPYNSSLLVTAGLLHVIGVLKMITPFPELGRDNVSILLSQHEHTNSYMQEAFQAIDSDILSGEERTLLLHTIGCVYESTERKPMLREALLLREAYHLLINVSNMEYFMNCHDSEKGSIFDKQMNNYLYLQAQAMDKEEQDG